MQGTASFKSLLHRSLQTKRSNYFFGETHYGCPQSLSSSDLHVTNYYSHPPICARFTTLCSSPQPAKLNNQVPYYCQGCAPEIKNTTSNLCKKNAARTNKLGKKCPGLRKFSLQSNHSLSESTLHPGPQAESLLNKTATTPQRKPIIDIDHVFLSCVLSLSEFDLCSSSAKTQNSNEFATKPSGEDLAMTKLKLSQTLPDFFEPFSKHPFEIYSKNLIFDNRINGTKSSGLKKYMSQAILLKNYTKLKFSSAKFVVLDITSHENDSTIKLRWRIVGVPHKVFQYLSLSKGASQDRPHDSWYDGFSIFHLGKDGLIYLHEADMVMPDEERQYVQKLSIGSQIAIALGLSPKPAISSFSSSRRKSL